MARGKKLSLEEQIQKIDSEIEMTEIKLSKLKNEKKDLQDKLKEEQLNELYSIIQTSGKTMDEVRNLLAV